MKGVTMNIVERHGLDAETVKRLERLVQTGQAHFGWDVMAGGVRLRAGSQPAEDLGQRIDSLDNLAHTLVLPLPAQIHVDSLRASLPNLVPEFKCLFTDATGLDPWGMRA